jgi:hypothetical protein
VRTSVLLRLVRLIDTSGEGCWEWQGARSKGGYGYFEYSRAEGGTSAHRALYIELFGPIPDGQVVCHRCDNPACCRPEHLHLGTQKQNQQDMVARGRARGFGRGERHPQARLTARDVEEIRRAPYPRGARKELAMKYGVTPQAISNVRSGLRRRVEP